MAIVCPSCNTPAVPGAIFCDNCGFDLRNVSQGAAPAPAPAAYTPQPAASVTCPACGQPNASDALFCENCGSRLGAPAAPAPPAFTPPPAQQAYPPPPPAASPVPPQPPAYAPPPQPVPVPPPAAGYGQTAVMGRLMVQGSNASLPIPPGLAVVQIGREDPVSNIFPDINLDPHGGQEAGVGRRHCRLVLQNGQLLVEDLSSVNGTFLNRQRLSPGQPALLNNGDELRLGRLVLVYYSI